MIVLHAHQALCELALVMVIDVTQHADAILRRFLHDSLVGNSAPGQVAKGFRTADLNVVPDPSLIGLTHEIEAAVLGTPRGGVYSAPIWCARFFVQRRCRR